MSLANYINFNGNCREAVTFYAKVFNKEIPKFQLFGDIPPDPSFPLPPEAMSLVMNTALNIQGVRVMFSDVPPNMPLIVGNNVSLVLISADKAEVTALYEKLKEGGTVGMPLQETFWSQLYGMVTDKFGIIWQISHEDGRNPMPT